MFDGAGDRFAVRVGSQLHLFKWGSIEVQPERLNVIEIPVHFAEFDWHPDGERIAAAGSDGLIYVVDVESGAVFP